MNRRIKELRKNLGLSQTEFGERVGVKQTTIAGYETGSKNPMDAVINSICRVFNVNETWLRSGEGEMFVRIDADEEFDQLCAEIQLSNDEFIKDIMRKYWKLSEEGKVIIRQMLSNLPE